MLKPLDLDGNPNLSSLHLGDATETYAGETATITGYGWNVVNLDRNNITMAIEETGGKSYNKMRFAKANVISNELCLKLVSSRRPVGKGHICAQVVQRQERKLEGVCAVCIFCCFEVVQTKLNAMKMKLFLILLKGDSGGPLVHGGDTLIGVVSTSPMGCIEKFRPAVYTRVSEYLDFIQKAIDHVMDPRIRYRYLKIEGIDVL